MDWSGSCPRRRPITPDHAAVGCGHRARRGHLMQPHITSPHTAPPMRPGAAGASA